MTPARLNELRAIAQAHHGHRSADYMNELITYCEDLRRVYGICLDYAYGKMPNRRVAFSKLQKLAER